MRAFKLRQDLKRSVIDGFALPLGIEPVNLKPPTQGFTIDYREGGQEGPDHYVFHVVASHERIRGLVREAFGLLPDEVTPIVEIDSTDAYRTVDVFVGREPIPLDEFLDVWDEFEPILMEDASLGAGANAEEPFVEVFLDNWKGLLLYVPIDFRPDIERMLRRHGLREVPETWPPDDMERDPPSQVREVLEIEDEQSPDLHEVLLQLREAWDLELDVDPENNRDERGRSLGMTLWNAVAVVESTKEPNSGKGAYVNIWASARSLADLNAMVEQVLDGMPEWRFQVMYATDRVAFDERPPELSELPLRRTKSEVHRVSVESW
ncbi:MAG: hypothetical protein KF724_04055 [Phycisphaeraceae bacterium]|nr:hypothetical protein [Phycisphaeraceae bacterium]